MSMTETVKPITAEERQGRLARLQASMASHGLDAVIVTPGANMRYFFGLTWRETERLVCAVISESAVVFVCPKFEDTALLAALSSPVDCVWWEEHEDPRQAVANVLGRGLILEDRYRSKLLVRAGPCAFKGNTVDSDVGWRPIPILKKPKVRDRTCATPGR